MEVAGAAVCTSRVVKMKKHLPFCRAFRKLCNEIELLLTVLPNFERAVALKVLATFNF